MARCENLSVESFVPGMTIPPPSKNANGPGNPRGRRENR
jgi:hypothetical protein